MKREDKILSLRAVLYACCQYIYGDDLKKAYCDACGSIIHYEDAISNVIDMIEDLESEVNHDT